MKGVEGGEEEMPHPNTPHHSPTPHPRPVSSFSSDATLTNNTWDIIVVQLGTNDAKDKADRGPPNWLDNCGALPNLDLSNCTFAQDYLSMIEVIRGLGTTPGVPPTIFLAIPVPLMAHGSIGANQTVINSVYPTLIPMIALAANVSTVPINNYAAFGGVPNWQTEFPPSCELSSPWPSCPLWCDKQSCDQCHPNDNVRRTWGGETLAECVEEGGRAFLAFYLTSYSPPYQPLPTMPTPIAISAYNPIHPGPLTRPASQGYSVLAASMRVGMRLF